MNVTTEALGSELERFISQVPAGSPGGIRIRDAAPQLESIAQANWLTARVDGQLVGAQALVPRPWGVWRCHLTVTDAHHQAAIDALVDAAREHTGGALCAGSCEDSHVHLRAALRRVGYRAEARMEVAIFSRPAADPDTRPARDGDDLSALLTGRGVHHDLPTNSDAFTVLQRRGRVVAGVAVAPGAWNIDSLGPGSAVTLPLVRRLGVQLLPLHFAGLVAGFGEPHDLERCWRAALHARRVPVGMVGADVTDPRWARWAKVRRGAVGRAIGTSTQVIYASGPLPRPLAWTADMLR